MKHVSFITVCAGSQGNFSRLLQVKGLQVLTCVQDLSSQVRSKLSFCGCRFQCKNYRAEHPARSESFSSSSFNRNALTISRVFLLALSLAGGNPHLTVSYLETSDQAQTPNAITRSLLQPALENPERAEIPVLAALPF